MKVHELDKSVQGKRIKVTGVAPSEAEKLGYVDDSVRLIGQEGLAQFLNMGSGFCQLRVLWDNSDMGLMLASEDEIEVLS